MSDRQLLGTLDGPELAAVLEDVGSLLDDRLTLSRTTPAAQDQAGARRVGSGTTQVAGALRTVGGSQLDASALGLTGPQRFLVLIHRALPFAPARGDEIEAAAWPGLRLLVESVRGIRKFGPDLLWWECEAVRKRTG